MTFSLLAHDEKTNTLAAAAATGNLAVGAWVLHAEAGVGLVASQGYSVSSVWSGEAMNSLRAGQSPSHIVDSLTSADSGSTYRQLTVMNTIGQCAGWTGSDNEDTKLHDCEPNLAIAGNWLRSKDVLPSMKSAWQTGTAPLAERLLQALSAAESAGGDSRGLLSAAIILISPSQPPIDLRIDYSEAPLSDLRALYHRTQVKDYADFMVRLPTIDNPYRC